MDYHKVCRLSSMGKGPRFGLKMRSLGIWTTFLAMLLTFAPGLSAQDNATITGTVMDASEAVVPNASLSLTNPATGQVREAKSNEAGAFRFANLGTGTYTLSAVAPGFKKSTRTGIVVNVAQTVAADVTLAVGSEEMSVIVAANALQVQTETSEISTLISGEQVNQLATNGRNIVQLAALGLGVSNTLTSFGGLDALTSSNTISFNGMRAVHNIYLIDGAEQNDRGCGGCFMNLPSQDAIAEFQTLGSNYQADYGIGSGGTIVMVLKSGTNKFHGELYEFNRNTAYNANDYFLKRSKKSRPVFQLNVPGGNIGGPLYIPHVYNENKNRTFFFWNEEWRRMIKGSTPSVYNALYASNFPTAGQVFHYTNQSTKTTPIVPNLPNNTAYNNLLIADGLTPGGSFTQNPDGTYLIPLNLIDQNVVAQLNAGTFPTPNSTPTGPGGAMTQYVASIKQPEFIREDAVRIDHSINNKFQLMGHYLHDAMQNTFFPPLWAGSFPTVGTIMQNPSYTAVIKLTQLYSSSLLNESGVYYGGNKIRLTPTAAPGYTFAMPSGYNADSFFPLANNRMSRLPQITLSGTPLSATWNPSYFPWKNGYEGFQYRDDLSWTKGRHQFKFGVSWLHDYKNQELQYNTNGIATFDASSFAKDNVINMIMGMAASYSQLEYLAAKNWVNNNYSGYAIDNWHVTPRLTLNLGLRYDGLPHAFERYNKFANFVPADYNRSLPNPVQSDGTLTPSQLSTFSKTGSEQFYLNGIREAGVDGFPRGNVENRYFTWQPRLGLAYDIFGNGKTVLRAGGGVFYERIQGNDVYNSALNPPFAYIPSATSIFFSNPNKSVLTGQTTSQHFPSNLTNIKYNYPPSGTTNFSLGIQHELMPSVVSVVQYVGSLGWDQNNDRAVNTLPLTTGGSYATRQGVSSGTLLANIYRQFPGFSNITQEENETNVNYNSLQAGVRFENKWGLTTQLAYTYSHQIDDVGADLNILPNPFDTRYARGSGAYDRRHIFNASYIYTLPFFKSSSNMTLRTILGYWGISGITVFQGGLPVNVTYNGTDTLGLGGGTTNRPNLVGKLTYPKKQTAWFSTSSYADPTAPWSGGGNQGFGNAGKDNMRGPGLNNFNISLMKTIQLTDHEGPNLELRFESFNIFNKTQFNGLDAANHDGNFGQVTSIVGPRVLELGGKIRF
ncbi:MAG TPA: TonB-dependent receptor [Terracidiphilus sp.]|nr:TonB-dependent receptor [Terracidiphilus sp.]